MGVKKIGVRGSSVCGEKNCEKINGGEKNVVGEGGGGRCVVEKNGVTKFG